MPASLESAEEGNGCKSVHFKCLASFCTCTDWFESVVGEKPLLKIGFLVARLIIFADVKQLKWEADRDRWLQGKNDWRNKKGGKSGRKQGHFNNKGKQFGGKAKHKGKRRK